MFDVVRWTLQLGGVRPGARALESDVGTHKHYDGAPQLALIAAAA